MNTVKKNGILLYETAIIIRISNFLNENEVIYFRILLHFYDVNRSWHSFRAREEKKLIYGKWLQVSDSFLCLTPQFTVDSDDGVFYSKLRVLHFNEYTLVFFPAEQQQRNKRVTPDSGCCISKCRFLNDVIQQSRYKPTEAKFKPADHWSCIAHLSAEDNYVKISSYWGKRFKHSPRIGADNPLGPNFWCQQEGLINMVICCKFKTDLFNRWLYTHHFVIW